MIVYLTLDQVLRIHSRALADAGGTPDIRDLGGVESAVAQPQMTFGGEDLYPSLAEKAAAIGYAIIRAQHFVDGNKRTGHAAMALFLALNSHQLTPDDDEQESVVLGVATGEMSRDDFVAWVERSLAALDTPG